MVTAANPIRSLPSALDERPRLRTRLTGRKLAVFLDYDGTLTPIVRRPDDAVLPSATRNALARAAERFPLAILSGRDLADVRAMVGLEGITYAGSHGFDIALPDGRTAQRGIESLPSLDAAEGELRRAVERIEGAWVERKRFAVAVHVREVDRALVPEVESAVAGVARDHPDLRRTSGKEVFELRPAIDWDKGRAVTFLLEALDLEGPDVVPIYVGDDETDEDAFRTIRDRGVAIVVAGAAEDRPTSAELRLEDPEAVRTFLEWLAS